MSTRFRTILVDDEPLAVQRLRGLLREYDPLFEIVAEASNGPSALALIEQHKPDLLFLDIEMPEMNGFQLLSKLSFMPMVVFATAYDEFAMKAFEENSIDYLLKPIEEERFAKTVEKIKNLKTASSTLPFDLSQLLKQLTPRKEVFSLTVKIGDRFLVIPLHEIVYFEAKERYVFLHTQDSQQYISDLTITGLEEKLPDFFIRISRAVLVNTKYIREIHRYFIGKFLVVMRDRHETRLQTGSHYLENVKRFMEGK